MDDRLFEHDQGDRRFGIMHEERIPFLEGRPEREEPIDADDVTNLIIALHTARTLEELLART
ncbi:MAG: hypothetical protein GF331_04885 [Chitinivibrionales bacterium]|nr:hypothetical protein [Chitinivibrionales bacterium]